MNETDQLELLFLFHKDGHIREAALRKISGPLPSPFFVAAVAYRINDWVQEVRVAAEACLERALPHTSPDIVASANMYLLSQIWQWQRADDCLQSLQSALSKADVLLAFARQLKQRVTGPVGRIFRNALRFEAMDLHLVELSRNAKSPATRYVATEALIDRRARWSDGYERQWIDRSNSRYRRIPRSQFRDLTVEMDVVKLMEQAAYDRAVIVRKLAAQKLIEHRHRFPNMVRLGRRLAEDKSRSVQERAEFYLLKMDARL